ncbi:MAG: hypothetical protein ACM3S4_10795, partial [Burkholderiales bacterium]
ALSEMGQQLSIAGLGTKIAPPVLEGELCQKCNRSIDNVDAAVHIRDIFGQAYDIIKNTKEKRCGYGKRKTVFDDR